MRFRLSMANELGRGHGDVNVPMTILGGCGGKLKMGQWIRGAQGFESNCSVWWAFSSGSEKDLETDLLNNYFRMARITSNPTP